MAADALELEDDLLFDRQMKRISTYRRNKVAMFRFRKDRNLCLGAGVLLDALLREFGLREQEMTYETNEYGKPSLHGFPDIHFNLSHAGHYVVGAIGSVELGIDVEEIRPVEWDVAERCMFPAELSCLRRLPAAESAAKFTRLWTLKESFLKTVGAGWGEDTFPEFEITAGRPPRLCGNRYKGYRFQEFGWKDYKVALCISSEMQHVSFSDISLSDEVETVSV
jgi:4'-phosphopantetheinyl transferase